MAYDIPVAALILDHRAAAATLKDPIKYPPNYFDDDGNDRYEGVKALAQLTGAPVSYFGTEDQSVYYIGLEITSDWCIEINPALAIRAAALKKQYQHPLIQTAVLAVVSQFN